MQTLKPDYAQAKAPGNPENFRGEAAIQNLNAGSGDDMEVLAVWFKNGARNIPHVHPSDQLLVVLEGRCVVATHDAQSILDAGQSALIRKGEWHWHGAATTQTAMHLSIKRAGTTDWKQPLHNFEAWQPERLAG